MHGWTCHRHACHLCHAGRLGHCAHVSTQVLLLTAPLRVTSGLARSGAPLLDRWPPVANRVAHRAVFTQPREPWRRSWGGYSPSVTGIVRKRSRAHDLLRSLINRRVRAAVSPFRIHLSSCSLSSLAHRAQRAQSSPPPHGSAHADEPPDANAAHGHTDAPPPAITQDSDAQTAVVAHSAVAAVSSSSFLFFFLAFLFLPRRDASGAAGGLVAAAPLFFLFFLSIFLDASP